MTFGDSVDETTAAGMVVDVFLAAGGTGIDTANGYAGGRSEEILGAVLGGRRDDVVLATKVGIPNPDAEGAAPLSAAGSSGACTRACGGSGRTTSTSSTCTSPTLDPGRGDADRRPGARRRGRGAHVGRLELRGLAGRGAAAHGAGLGLDAPVLGQQVYSVIATRIDDEYAEYARSTGLATVVYNPLGGGLLTGRHRPDEHPAEGRFGSSPRGMYRDRYWNDEVFAAVERLRSIADGAGLPMAELALRWTIGPAPSWTPS